MSGASIAAEVNAALAEVARDVGDGTYTITLKKPATQPVNPWDTPAGAATDYEVNAMISDYPKGMIDGTLIQQGDKRIMASALDVDGAELPTVDVNWRVVSGSTNYAIMSIREVAPSGVVLYLEIQGRA